jgi:hypothetical protein
MNFRLFACLVLLLPACSRDENPVTPVLPVGKPGVYILNEGNFQRANASLSYFVSEDGTVIADVYKQENSRDLGDTGNSLTLYHDRLYIVMNGSNRIEVIDNHTKKRVKTFSLPDGASPRHLVFDEHGRGFISCLYTNEVIVYDDSVNTITARVPVGANPEQMLVWRNHLFVTNSGLGAGSTVSVIDIGSPNFPCIATLKVGDNPTAIQTSWMGRALVLCTGAYNDFQNPNDDTPGKLFEIDTEGLHVTDSLVLGGHPQRLVVDAAGDFYTIREDGIMKVRWGEKSVTPRLIPGGFYGVYYHWADNTLLLADALDYVQPGKVHVYSMTGVLQRSFGVGIIPGSMMEAN